VLIKPSPNRRRRSAFFKQIKKRLKPIPGWFTKQRAAIKGVSEETTTGVHRLYRPAQEGPAALPGDQRQRLVTKSKFDNKYGCKESLVDGIRRATDVMMAGKVAVVCGYGDVGKGSAASLRGAGARVKVTEVDPICALQAAMDGFEVVTLWKTSSPPPTSSSPPPATRTSSARAHARDEGHGHRRQHRPLRQRDPGRRAAQPQVDNIKPQVDMIEMPRGKRIILLSEGRLLNLGNATGHPSFVMSASFTNQTLAQIELWTNGKAYENKVYIAAEGARREGRPPAPEQARRQADRTAPRPGRLYRRRAGRPVQAGTLPLSTWMS
jgi:adenosylhomocysteinase